jgi:hypothetical protein
MRIVVARYNENVEWTRQFNNVTIYNKGEPLNDEFNEIYLNNVGKEGHTFYKHICDNYDNLDDYTIFLQGDPFPHSNDLLLTLKKYIHKEVIPLDFNFISKDINNCNLIECKWYKGEIPFPLKSVFKVIFNQEPADPYRKIYFGPGGAIYSIKNPDLKKAARFLRQYSRFTTILR